MPRLPLSLCLVLAICAGLLVTSAVPAHAIQYMTPGFPGGGGGASEKKTVVDKLKKKWEEQPEVVKEEVQEQVDKAKDLAQEEVKGQAKKAGGKLWKKIKKLKKLRKYAKKAGEVLKRYKRVLGPAGQVWDAAEKGYKTGGKLHQRVVGPLMAAHFDRKDEEWQRQLQEDIAKIRRNGQVTDSPAPDTLEHYADQTLQDYLDSLPPMDDSQDFAEVLEQYNEARRSEQPAPYESPQEPHRTDTAADSADDPNLGSPDYWADLERNHREAEAQRARLQREAEAERVRWQREAEAGHARMQREAEAEAERARWQREAERERQEQEQLEREHAAWERDYERRRREMNRNPDPYGVKTLNRALERYDPFAENNIWNSSERGHSQGGSSGRGYSQGGSTGGDSSGSSSTGSGSDLYDGTGGGWGGPTRRCGNGPGYESCGIQ